jgi:hypothetical protein
MGSAWPLFSLLFAAKFAANSLPGFSRSSRKIDQDQVFDIHRFCFKKTAANSGRQGKRRAGLPAGITMPCDCGNSSDKGSGEVAFDREARCAGGGGPVTMPGWRVDDRRGRR